MKANSVAVVDPYAAGALLGPEFRRRGVPCLGVHSTGDVPFTFRSSYSGDGLAEELRYEGDHPAMAAVLREREPLAVIAGCELGVDLAERLAYDLGLPTHDPALQRARRDKVAMIEAVRRSGLRTPEQTSSDRVRDLVDWSEERGMWPVVVKPSCGTASEGVSLCGTGLEVSRAADAILERRNSLGVINERILAQEFVGGAEYAVDTVSCRGRHRLTAAWRYGRISPETPSVGYESMTLLPGCEELAARLFTFVRAALDALGICNGAAHTEVIDSREGLTFLETGARLCGGVNPRLSRVCSGEGQVELLADSILAPDAFLERTGEGYRLDRSAVLVFLVPRIGGRLTALPRLAEIEALPSFDRVGARARPDEVAPRIVGWVSLVHEDAEALERDLARIRWLEENGLYELEPSTPAPADDPGDQGDGS